MIGKPKNRRKQSERKRSASHGRSSPRLNWRRIGMTLVSLAGVGAAAGVVLWSLDQPIDTVTVAGRFARVSPADVERAVKQKVRNVGLVSVDLNTVRGAIVSIPWVDKVTVQRAWPHGLAVVVTEQVAAARWRDSGPAEHARRAVRRRCASRAARARAALRSRWHRRTKSRSAISSSQGRVAEAGLRITAIASRCARRVGVRARERRHGATRSQTSRRTTSNDSWRRRSRSSLSAQPTSSMSTCATPTGLQSGGRGATPVARHTDEVDPQHG